MATAIISGAQTERRGDAGPVRGLLGGKDLTGRLLLSHGARVAAAASSMAAVSPISATSARQAVEKMKKNQPPRACRSQARA